MIKIFIFILFQFLSLNVLVGQNVRKEKIENIPFSDGESLEYKFRYGFVNCATGSMSVSLLDDDQKNPKFKLVAKGQTSSALSIIMDVNNRYESYIDTATLLPSYFYEKVHENNYKRETYARFYRDSLLVHSSMGIFPTSDKTLDVLSALYYARSFDLSNLKEGDLFRLEYFLKNKTNILEIRYIGKEVVKTDLGKIECLKFSPTLVAGRAFKEDSKMYLWISNDKNRIPIKASVEIIVGSLYLDIISVKNLKYPMIVK